MSNGKRKAAGFLAALAIGLTIGLLIDAFYMNFDALESAGVQEVAPAQVLSVDPSAQPPYLNAANGIDYVFGPDDDVVNVRFCFDEQQVRQYTGKSLVVSLLDEGNGVFYPVGKLELSKGDTWLRLHPAGRLEQLRLSAWTGDAYMALGEASLGQDQLYAYAFDGDIFVSAQFNTPKPYQVHWPLIATAAALALLAWVLRPSSQVYRRRFDGYRWFPLAVAACVVLVVTFVVGWRYSPMESEAVNERQYFELAEALAHGRADLLADPSEELQAMDNPYDMNMRHAMQVPYSWDHAYYNGRYYVYFGVLPCLATFFPYYLVTGGGELPMWAAIVLELLFLTTGVMKLLISICRRWFPSCSQALFLVFAFTIVSGSWMQYAAIRPTHYSLPILMALALASWGLALWIDATARPKISKLRSVVGSVLIASIVGARPQLLVVGLFVFVLLALHARRHGGREALAVIGCCALPVLAVFGMQGWYNYIRFDSPLDFGANYNLTTNDMTKRGWDVGRAPLALVAYFVQPPSLGADAPFLRTTDLAVSYYGTMITERMVGGVFWLTPLLASVFLMLFGRCRRRVGFEKGALVVAGVLSALVVAMFDAQGAGVLMRYFMDFGIFLSIGAVLTIGGMWGSAQQPVADDVPIERAERVVDADAGGFTTAGMFLLALEMCAMIPVVLYVLSH